MNVLCRRVMSGLVRCVLWAALVQVWLVAAVPIQGSVLLNRQKLGFAEDADLRKVYDDMRVLVLRGGEQVAAANVDSSGKFSTPNVDVDGNYTLYFTHPSVVMAPIVATVEGSVVRGFKYDPIRTNQSTEIEYPFGVVGLANNSPYVPEEKFDFLQLFKNPMVIMGLVMVALVYISPKLQGNVSQEEMREMRKEMEADGGFAANILKNFIPAGAGDSAGGASNSGNLPSISSNNESRRRK